MSHFLTQPVTLDAGFPGGNLLVDAAQGDTFTVRQDLRDTQGHWFYWYFRVLGGNGRRLTFEFNDRNAIGVHGPAVSHDAGQTWAWAGAEAVTATTFSYDMPADASDVRFAMGVPYVRSDLDRWLNRHDAHGGLRMETLCESRSGHEVPLLSIGPGGAEHGVVLTCRHHCCEAMASYVLEGVMDQILADPWWAEHAHVRVIPLVDYDGVQAGDQGKNRSPHDHNRDYNERPIYPETRAIRELVQAWPGGRPDVWLDLHCPWIRGTDCNQMIYQVGSRHPGVWSAQQRFGQLLQRAQHNATLPYHAQDDLPYGQLWNVDDNENGFCKSTRWAAEQAGIGLASTLEIPYADVHGQQILPDTARELGRNTTHALAAYLQSLPQHTTAQAGPTG